MHSLNLIATSASRSVSDSPRYRAVINNQGMAWWVSGFEYRDSYSAEEAARLRLMKLLDDLRGESAVSGETP